MRSVPSSAMITLLIMTARAASAEDPKASVTQEAQLRADDPIVHVRFPPGFYLPYLDRQIAGGWELACRAPCDTPLPSGDVYRIRGRQGHPTEPFVMPRAARVTVDATVASPAAGVVGPLFAVSGGVFLVGGAALAVWPAGESDDRTSRIGVGIGAMIVGAISVGLGAFLWHYGSSHASVSPEEAAPRSIPSTSSSSRPRWTGTGISF